MSDIQRELEALLSDIVLISNRLLPSPKTVDYPILKAATKTPPSPPRKPRVSFTKLTAKFRQARHKPSKASSIPPSSDGSYTSLPGVDAHPQLDFNGERRDSDASDQTFVDMPSPATVGQDASSLLAFLAPLISALQRITPRMKAVTSHELSLISDLYQEVCEELIILLTTLNKGCSAVGGDDNGYENICDEHDLEMRSLLLSALVRKVQAEENIFKAYIEARNREKAAYEEVVKESPSVPSAINEYAEKQVEKMESCISRTPEENRRDYATPVTRRITCPLLPSPTINPFILHSSSLTPAPHIRPSPAIPLPISYPRPIDSHPKQLETALNVQPSLSFQSFVTASQMSTAGLLGVGSGGLKGGETVGQWGVRDVFRLGSFQNSLLFSPSPVAVRRPLIGKRVETQG